MEFTERFEKIVKLPLSWFYEILIIAMGLAMAQPTVTSLILGGSVAATGLLIRSWSRGYPEEKNSKAIYGPYCFVKHPYHLGTFLLLLGLAFTSRSLSLILFILIGTAIILRKAEQEDEKLHDHSQATLFKEYRSLVPTFVPTLWPYRGKLWKDDRFSWSQAFVKGSRRELEVIFLLGLVYIAFFIFYYLQASYYIKGTVGGLTFLAGVLILRQTPRQLKLKRGYL